MSTGTLPDLLDALGELFLAPGARPAPALAAVREADWPAPPLRAALGRLLAAPTEDLDVAYASLFLARTGRPTLRLGASALRTGLHRDPAILASLAPRYAAAGVRPKGPHHPDDLGCLLLLLARLLRQLAAGREEREAAVTGLFRDPLESLARAVAAELAEPGVPAYYAAAGAALDAAMDGCADLLR